MTCIVGIEHDGVIVVGGDTLASNNGSVVPQYNPKVFRLRNGMIIGFTYSYRQGDLLRYSLQVPPHDSAKTDHEYLATDFVTTVRQLFEDHKVAKTEDDVSSGGLFLLAYKGHLYRVDTDYHVGRTELGYDAVGGGADFALGSLATSETWRDPGSDEVEWQRRRVEAALEAAELFSSHVRRPWLILSTRTDE